MRISINVQSDISPPSIPLIGVDVAKDSLVIAIYPNPASQASQSGLPAQAKPISIANNPNAIKVWLKTLPSKAAIAMESTGKYQLELATQAYKAGHSVYVINAMVIHHYAKSQGQRGKTDRLDSQLIAQYLAKSDDKLRLWQPTPAHLLQLRALLKSRSHLADTNAKLKMALKDVKALTVQTKALDKKFQQTMDFIDAQVQRLIAADAALAANYKLLRTINGVGPQGAALLTTLLGRVKFENADALVGFSGFDPLPEDSGQKQGKRRLSKRGDAMIRRQMWLSAMAASRSAVFKPMYQALQQRGIPKIAALVVIARKLLRIAFAVCKSGKAFDGALVGVQANVSVSASSLVASTA